MNKTPARETMSKRLRAVFSPALRSERGALNNALILTIAATLLVVVAATWFMFRQTLDTTTAQQAQVRSSINQLATNVLGQMNQEFPSDWQEMDSTSLTEATEQFGNTPELGANSYLTYFAVNPKTGVVTAEAQGKSTGALGTSAKARIQFVPSGAGVFTGLDEQDRPIWVYSNDNLDALALWEMNPNSIEYLTPGGDYTSEAPETPPTVTLTPRNEGAQVVASFSVTYCQFGGTAEYRYRVQMDDGEFGSWSAWAKTREFTTNLVQGQRIAVQAMARCVTSISATDPTPPSAIAEYTRPVNAPAGPPTLTIANTGVASWTAVACATGTQTQYQFRARLNEGSWATWSDWAQGVLSNNTGANQGARIEFQVRARCISPYAVSDATSTAHAQLDRPITSVPTKPTVSVTNGANGATTAVSTAAGVAGLTAEYRYRMRVNGDDSTWKWSDWAIQRSASTPVDQGDKVEGQGQSRYTSPYLDGAASAESNIVTLLVPVTFKPNPPKLTIASNYSTWTLGTVTCAAGTTTRYTFHVTIDGTTREQYTRTTVGSPTRGLNLTEGQTVKVTATAECLGTGSGQYGPASDQAVLEETRALDTPPLTPTITYAANGAPTWVKGGCPAGTTWQSTFRYQENAGGWGDWRAWTSANSAGSPIGQGERVMFQVQARCASGSMVGPVASSLGAWHVYAITSQPTVGGKITLTGTGPITATFTNPSNCPATTTVRTSSRTAVNDTWTAYNGWTTSEANRSINATDGDVARAQMRAMCVSAYDQGPVYEYGVTTRTSEVESTASGTLNVAFASTWNSFNYTAVTCPTGLTIQYRTVVKEGINGTNTGGAWGGRVASQAIPKWEYGDDYSVTVQLRCVNSYSNAVGPTTSSRTFTDTRPIPTPGQPNVLAQSTTSVNITANKGCPAGQANLVTEMRNLGRVHWAGAWNEMGNYEYEKGWSGWATSSSYGIIAEEGRSAIWYGQQRCRNTETGVVSEVGQGTTGWFIRPVSAGTKAAYRIAYRHFGHNKGCYNGAWAAEPWFWITLNRATGWALNGGNGAAIWEYNNQGGTWGTVDYNSRALCTGPYANGGWQYAGGSW